MAEDPVGHKGVVRARGRAKPRDLRPVPQGTIANSAHSGASDRHAVLNAHAILDRSRALNSPEIDIETI